jgi:hypothetical protein
VGEVGVTTAFIHDRRNVLNKYIILCRLQYVNHIIQLFHWFGLILSTSEYVVDWNSEFFRNDDVFSIQYY